MADQLMLKAYGKINLGLDVLCRREDGYHDVRMIMQTVRLYDGISIAKKKEPGISLETNLYYLPENENNLACRAAKLLFDEFHIEEGIHIKLNKFIPVAAGMAGGSSDAAAVMFGVNKMFGLKLSAKQLMDRGVKIGADVPYCLMRGTVLAEGIGEVLTPLPPMPACSVLIAKPAVSVSTKMVYENLHVEKLSRDRHPDIDGMIDALHCEDYKALCSKLGNILEEVTIKEYPVIQTIKDMVKAGGADGVLMSGSGPTVFGLFADEEKAKAAYEHLRFGEGKGIAKQVYLTSLFNIEENKRREK